jgi:hypothetical protein
MAVKKTPLEKKIDEHEKQGYDAVADAVMVWFRKMLNHRATLGLDDILYECDRRYNGKLAYVNDDPDDASSNLEISLGITGMLCRTAYAWLEGAFFNAQDRPWALEPTPVPKLPPELQARVDAALAQHIVDMTNARTAGKELGEDTETNYVRALQNTANFKAFELAKEAIKGMERRMEDEMIESKWRDMFQNYLRDFVKYPFAVMKGPLYGPVLKKGWNGDEVIEEYRNGYTFENVNPFDIFWSPEAKSFKTAKAVIHRVEMSASDILELDEMDDVVKDGISLVLASKERDYADSSKLVKNDLDDTTSDPSEQAYQVYNFYGLITGSDLLAFVSDEEMLDIGDVSMDDPRKTYSTKRFGEISLYKTYDVFAMVCRGHTLMLRASPSVSQSRPFHSATSYPRGEGIIGSCIPLVLADLQDALDRNFQAAVFNSLMSSGPIITVSAERFAGKNLPETIAPWSVHVVSNSNIASNNNNRPIDFNTMNNNLQQHIALMREFKEDAHRIAGLPPYMYGDNTGSPRTLGAFSLQYGAATKSIKVMIAQIDHGVIEPAIEQFYDFLMRYDEDTAIKADAQVRVRGSQGLIAQEQRQARPLELSQAMAPLLSMLGPEKSQPIIEKFINETLTENGYDPATMGLDKEGLAAQEAQARALEGPQLDGRSDPAIQAQAGQMLPPA